MDRQRQQQQYQHLNSSTRAGVAADNNNNDDNNSFSNSAAAAPHLSSSQPTTPTSAAAFYPANSGVPMWLKRLRRIDKSLSSALEASATARQQSALGFPDGADDLFLFEGAEAVEQLDHHTSVHYDASINISRLSTNTRGTQPGVSGSVSNNNISLPLVSPNINSSPQRASNINININRGDATYEAASYGEAVPSMEPPPRNPAATTVTSLSTNTHHNEKGEVTLTFPGAAYNRNNKSGHPNVVVVSTATVPTSAVSTCVICRATPREVAILEEEVARLRAFVTVQRESFQMQLDDIRESHVAEMKQVTESAQTELNERLVAYMREVDDLKKHVALADSAVMQLAKLKSEHTDLGKRYEMLLAAVTNHGGSGAAAAAAAAAGRVTITAAAADSTPMDQKSHRGMSQQQQQQQQQQAAVPASPVMSTGNRTADGDWEIEKMELLAEVEHWKRQAVVSGVAAKTAIGAHALMHRDGGASSSSAHSASPPVAEPPFSSSSTKNNHNATKSALKSGTTGSATGYQRPEPTYTSSLPDAMSRLEAWRKEVNPGHSARLQQQQQQQPHQRQKSLSVSQPRPVLDVSPSTAVQTPQHHQQSLMNRYGGSLPPEVTSSGGSSSMHTADESVGAGAASNSGVSERDRWMKLMENIVGGK